MGSFFNVLEDTKEKLGRQLYQQEIEFLQWMYERYQDEQKESEILKIKSVN